VDETATDSATFFGPPRSGAGSVVGEADDARPEAPAASGGRRRRRVLPAD